MVKIVITLANNSSESISYDQLVTVLAAPTDTSATEKETVEDDI